MRQTSVWLEGIRESNGLAVSSATVEMADRNRVRVWYNVPVGYKSMLTEGAEPFVLATIFTAMRQSTDLVVHGDASPSLLRHLAEYQGAWSCWNPTKYTKVEILPDKEREQPLASNADRYVSAFSGGVDSCFTAFRHRTSRAGRLNRNLTAAVMMHGHDIPIDQAEVFQSAADRSAKMLTSLGVEFIPVVSNVRDLRQNIMHAHGALISSCLMLLQRGFVGGLIPSSHPYHDLSLECGSNPIVDWLLSSGSFRIIHDGAELNRTNKVREIADWPEALTYLRVCWEGDKLDRNCGHCEKCIRTILNFRVLGLGLPSCFKKDVRDEEILGLVGLQNDTILHLEEILTAAKAASISQSWVSALERCIKRNRRALNRGPSLKERIKRAACNYLPWLGIGAAFI